MLGVALLPSGVEFVETNKEQFLADHKLTFTNMPQFLATEQQLATAYERFNTVPTETPLVWGCNAPLSRLIKAISVPLDRESEDVLLEVDEVINKLSTKHIVFLFHGKDFGGALVFNTLTVQRSVLDRHLKVYNLLKEDQS